MSKVRSGSQRIVPGAGLLAASALLASLSGCADMSRVRQTSCANNEKQIGLALVVYIQDYDEKLPSFSYVAPSGQKVGPNPPKVRTSLAPDAPDTLITTLYPYIKSTGVFACPEDPVVPRPNILDNILGNHPSTNGERSYIYSGPINTVAHQPDPSTGLVDSKGMGYNIAVLMRPAETVALVEAWGGSIGAHPWDSIDGSVLVGCDTWKIAGRQSGDASGAPPGCTQYTNTSLIPCPGHSGIGNTLYIDGHVGARTWAQLKQNDFYAFKRM